MTLTLDEYQIFEKINQGINTDIYRGVRQCDRTPVILKVLGSAYPKLEELTRFRNEYEISKNIKTIPGIVQTLELLNYHNGLALVFTDMGGISLKQYLQQYDNTSDRPHLSLKEFLPIAIQLTTTLGEIHGCKIVHKDIKPQNIIINPETKDVKITDFSIATRLSELPASVIPIDRLEGTLAYMSPEQTGRMNRILDYRSDYYSLGVTFYELLTGYLPFLSDDPLELIHCHIAKNPPNLRQFNPEIPKSIEALILKLLAKNAEDRYQSPKGLMHDLETCWQQLATTGKISNFIPGASDRAGQLLIPQKLYGRAAEVAQLMATFDRAANPDGGPPLGKGGQFGVEMMLVSGYSGIGKTALVSEVHKPIVKSRGYFISGKFDQYKRNIPYASLIQAFSELIRQLLTEPETSIQTWKQKLLEALGSNGQVICDVIPEVELIVGPQPEVPSLGPTESQNRFNRVFQQFIGVFTTQEHPLVIFLDDLQWADSASLKLIHLLLTNPDRKYLLFIGAYRDNEVSPTHPTIQTIEKIASAGTPVNNIVLAPLQLDHVRALITDTLTNSSAIEALADLLFNKTQGNPFFLTQLLKTLYAESLLVYDFPQSTWQWNIQEIQALGITDYNVVELMARNLQKLPAATQQILKLAACIGNQFKLEVLAIVSEKSQNHTASDLWSALQIGLILPLSQDYKIPLIFSEAETTSQQLSDVKVNYKFLHDRVQQAAYSLIPESQKQETHLKIGQLLLQNTSESDRENNIFALVNQLNYGINLLKTHTEKNQLANLNLIAGKKAKEATAYEAAVKYLNLGINLLDADSWNNNYETTLALYIAIVEAEYLNTNYERSQQLCTLALTKIKNLLNRVSFYEIKINFYMAQNQLHLAIDTGLGVLEMLDISLLKNPPNGHSPRDLVNLPEMTDPDKLVAMRILSLIFSPALNSKPELLPMMAFTMVNLCIEHGNSPLAAIAYDLYGLLLCGGLGDIELGYQFGQLALTLQDKFNAQEIKCRVFEFFYGFIWHWKQPLKDSLDPLEETIQVGLETGDITFASFASLVYVGNIFCIGKHLEWVNHKHRQYIDMLDELKQELHLYYAKIWGQIGLNLTGQAANSPKELTGELFDESKMLPILQESKNLTSIYCAYFAKTLLSYLFKDYSAAVANASLASEYEQALAGLMPISQNPFYHSLALLALYPTTESIQQIEYLEQVEANQQKFKLWANHAPMNFQHKYHLVEAEKARVLGQTLAAMELYDRAISGAQENEYIQDEALANELAAEFYLSLGREKVAKAYMTDAYYGYAKWGAVAKIEDLETQYPQLLEQIKQPSQVNPNPEIETTQTTLFKTNLGSSAALDLTTVMKASQAISSEIVLDKLLAKLINILLENAAAEKAFLFLKEKEVLRLAASTEINQEAIVYQLSALGTRQCRVPTPVHPADLPLGIVNYVQRTNSHLTLTDARTEGLFTNDPYITSNQVKSVLCAPIIKSSKLVGIIYLENNLISGAFTRDRLEVLQMLSGQAAISLELARSVNQVQSTLAYLKTIINNIADGLLVTDPAGRIAQFNPALSNLFQSPASELTGQDCTEVLSPEIGDIVTQSLSNPQEIFSAEIPLTGGRIGGAVATAIATDDPDELIGCVTIIRDITVEKEIDRMKTDFISTVSHELRTPLTSVVGFAKIIHKKLNDQVTPALAGADKKTLRAVKQIGDNINIIISEGERLTALINDVLDIAKMEAGKIEWNMQPVNLEEVIDRAVSSTASLWQLSGLQLIKELPPELPEVNGDPARLLQVLINLISNALKFTDQGSITLKAFKENQQIIVSVIDTGIGIHPNDCDKVFDKFKQVGEVMTDKPKGTGLGLQICQQIIQHHQGRIWVESEIGVGSNFSFALPLESPNLAETEPLNIDSLVRQLKQRIVPKSSEPTNEQKTILVVDDEPAIRSLLRQQLEEQEYLIVEAANGMEAISQVKKAPPDLIILDVMMPSINGFDVAAVLKNNPSTMDIPIIILSIFEDKERGWQLGIDRYLTKPIDSEKLLNDIGVLISRGTSPKKVMVVDEDVSAINTLTEVLIAKGYSVVEALSGWECIQKALQEKPDMIIVDSVVSQQHDLVKTLRFEKGLENVFFVVLAGHLENYLKP